MITLPATEVALLHSADLILIKCSYVSSKFHLFQQPYPCSSPASPSS